VCLPEDSIAKWEVLEACDPVAQGSHVVDDLCNVEGRFPCWEKLNERRSSIVHSAPSILELKRASRRTWRGEDLHSEVFEQARRVGQPRYRQPKAWTVSRYQLETADSVEGRRARKPCTLRVVGSVALPLCAISSIHSHLKGLDPEMLRFVDLGASRWLAIPRVWIMDQGLRY
jgi:hypothetical protein